MFTNVAFCAGEKLSSASAAFCVEAGCAGLGVIATGGWGTTSVLTDRMFILLGVFIYRQASGKL